MRGTVAVSGMAYSKAHLIRGQRGDTGMRHVEHVESELERLGMAVKLCVKDLSALMEQLRREGDSEYAEILDFQVLLLEDENYIGQIRKQIETERVNCEYAVAQRSEAYRQELSALDNPYLNERAADITDIEERLLKTLGGYAEAETAGPMIAAAVDLTPSQVVELGRKGLQGIVLEKGGLSSHCVILARSMNIPCIIGAQSALSQVREGQMLLLDGVKGEVTVEPSEMQVREFERYREKAQAERESLEQFRRAKTVTADGKPMRVYANITAEIETKELLKQGGEGVGLLRTEMLYMERQAAPDEEVQFSAYSKIVKALEGRPLIVRTLDVGGDKHIPYLNIPQEENPFLGYRAIRYCLEHPEIFRAQLGAILRAAAFGPVQLMLPMIASVSEVERAKEEIRSREAELKAQGIETGKVSIGMMVETPAAAVMADQFAKQVDFFSIGTNDLTQYLFAADRNNAKVSSLNSYFQPALLRAVDHICRCARREGIEVDICGQAGEVEELIPLWVGMGVDNLSVSIPSIPRVRRRIKSCDTSKCRELADRVLELASEEEVRELIRREVGE